MTEYRYGMRLRGFSIGTQPKDGLIRREDSNDDRYYDILVYGRPLTQEELRDYELDDLQPTSELPSALDKLCEATGIRREGIAALLRDYTNRCHWPEAKAVDHIMALCDDGTIDELQSLK